MLAEKIISASEMPISWLLQHPERQKYHDIIHSLPIHVTNDVAFSLHHSQPDASTLKAKFQSAGLPATCSLENHTRSIVLVKGYPIYVARPMTDKELFLYKKECERIEKKQESCRKMIDTRDHNTKFGAHL
jgi:hypothetical protein